ncbi:MFS transporter [Methanobacterium aggregans]|uniref:MFS transporter n=1 Tax=Methanobacterium aggregans TaxID=1615586 RepID=UPI00320D04E2
MGNVDYGKNNVKNSKTRERLTIFTLALPMFIWSFSAGIVTISLPTISQYLDIGTGMVSWVVVAHLIILTSFLLIFGRLGDYIGYKKVFLYGILLFTIGSYFCGISLDIFQLIASRIFQGVGSAMMLSMTPALVSSNFEHHRRGWAFGYISLATTLALALGYGVGSFITENMGWHWIFFSTVPMGIFAIYMVRTVIPHEEITKKRPKFDLAGSLLVFLAVMNLILPLELGKTIGWTSPLIMGTFSLSVIITVIFFVWESRQACPLFDVSLLKNLQLSFSITAAFLISTVLTGTIFLLPFYLELVMGYSTDFAGLLILAPTLLIIFAGPISGRVSDKFGSRIPTIIAGITLTVALILFTLLDQTIGIVFIFIALAVRSLSEGIFSPANTKQVMSHSKAEKMGSVSSLLNTGKYLGLVMGVVLFETVFEATIKTNSSNIEGMTSNGAFQMSAPVNTLLTGFHDAFLMGVVISILILIFILLSHENSEIENSEVPSKPEDL